MHVFLASALVALLSGATTTASAQTVVERPSVEDLVDPPAACANIVDVGGWGQIGLPNFSRGEQVAQSYTVDAYNKKRLFVTNGIEIYRSMNAGCSWTKVYELPATPSQNKDFSELDSRIEQVTVPKGTTGDRIVYFTIDQYRAPQGVARGTRSRIFRSENNGNSWIASDGELPEVLPPHGGPEQLLPTPAFPKVLYLLMEAPDVQYLATSPDGGETWKTSGPVCVAPVLPSEVGPPVTAPQPVPGVGCIDPDAPGANPGVPSDVAGIAVDPFEPNELWYYGPRGLERSANSGAGPKKIEQIDEPIGAVDIFKSAGGEARVVATGANAPTLHISLDGGKTWDVNESPGFVDSIAKGRVAREFFLATDLGVYLHIYGSALPISPSDRRTIVDIQSARSLGGGADTCVYGSSGAHLEGACLSTNFPPPPPEPPVIDPIPPGGGPIDNQAARFNPEDLVVTLDRGESRVVPYTLELFKSPTPLDVYFLIDISGSMQNTIDGVARGLRKIIGALMEDKIDTHFGLGVYRAYDSAPAYRRVIDISPPGKPLQRALETLIANSGGDETQLAALYQSATGAGQDVDLIAKEAHIEPNQQANFRDQALKVIIHATDEKFSVLPPNPSFDDVITALNEDSIEQVGLAIQYPGDGGSEDDPEYVQVTPRQGLARVAEGTQTFAVEDVDCNGDGDVDIPSGEPLVCDINPERAQESALMSGAIVELLNSVEDVGDVQVDVSAPPGVVSNISSHVFSPINFKKPPDLNFEVMYTCPIDGTQKEYPVELSAQARGVPMAYTTATVRCRDEVKVVPPKRRKPQPPPEEEDPNRPPAALTPFFPIPAFAPPIVRPPEMSPNPGPQSQSQTQSQSQAQAQNAMARQKQEQVQLAYAYSKSLKAELAAERATNQAGDDLNMSKYRSTSSRRQEQVPPGLALMLTASAMTLAAGIAATRYKTKPNYARRNRRRY